MEKLTKKQNTIKWIVIVVALAAALSFLVNSFAPANPRAYHVYFLSAFHGSFNKKGLPGTYWQPEQRTDGNVRKICYLRLSGSSDCNEVWINLSDFKELQTDIIVASGAGAPNVKKRYNLTAKELKKSKDGWIKIYDKSKDSALSSSYLNIGFTTNIRVREVVAIKSDGKKSTLTVQGWTIENSTIGESGYFGEPEQYPSLKNVVDEQDKFKR